MEFLFLGLLGTILNAHARIKDEHVKVVAS